MRRKSSCRRSSNRRRRTKQGQSSLRIRVSKPRHPPVLTPAKQGFSPRHPQHLCTGETLPLGA
eukprot:2648925-Pyramimonas_sp.AAC.1